MIAAYERRRATPYTPISGDMLASAYVGGELHVAEISAGGVFGHIAHRWPNRVGEPIGDAPGLRPAARLGERLRRAELLGRV